MPALSVDHIIESVGRVHPDLALDRSDAIAWSFEVLRDGDTTVLVEEGMWVDVVRGRISTPCNLFRLLRVSKNGDACGCSDYTQGPGCINMHDLHLSRVFLYGMFLPVNEDGGPQIPEHYEAACMSYCVWKMLVDPMVKGNMPRDIFDRMEMQYREALQKARANMQFISRDELDRVVRMLHSFLVGRRLR